MSVREEIIAGFETIAVDAPDSAPAIVLLHGYGAHFRDLFPLYQMLRPQSPCAWYFPNGPVKVFTGMPEFGRAWFPLDPERLQMLAAARDYVAVAKMNYAGMDDTTEQLSAFLNTIASRHENLIIGGFSQGAMLATNVAMNTDIPLSALTLFSTSIAKQEEWSRAATKRNQLPVFQSHGLYDPVLPFTLAETMRELMIKAGWQVAFHEFPGMHEIPPQVLSTYRSFLDRLLIPVGD